MIGERIRKKKIEVMEEGLGRWSGGEGGGRERES